MGDAETILGKLLEPEIGAAGIGAAVGFGEVVGSALDTDGNVEAPIRTVGAGLGNTLGC